MHPHTTTSVAAPLAVAGLLARLTTPEATAQERITLETIGAVCMIRFEEVRCVNLELRPAQAPPARDLAAGRIAKTR